MGNLETNMEYKSRMIRKAIVAGLGIVLLFLLFFFNVLEQGDTDEIPRRDIVVEPEPEPVYETFYNIYVLELNVENICFYDGISYDYPIEPDSIPIELIESMEQREGMIANVYIRDGLVYDIQFKADEKINGKVYSVDAEVGVEIEDYGIIPLADDVKVYVLYGELRIATLSDIRIGYDFSDFVIDNGEICAAFLAREEDMDFIRVRIKNSDYTSGYHDVISLTADTSFTVCYDYGEGQNFENYSAGEVITISKDDELFSSGILRLFVKPDALTGKITVSSITRALGVPSYRGIMEIGYTKNGLLLINEVLLEEYLYAVVPSEMPSSYPMEALKAQAICARTYAYSNMLHATLSSVGAHVDDSTSYQVYNNIKERTTTTNAVKETKGKMLYSEGELVDTYYYSTSCGFGVDERVWDPDLTSKNSYLVAQSISDASYKGEELPYTAESMMNEEVFTQFLHNPPQSDFEKNDKMYRWEYEVETFSSETLLAALVARYEKARWQILTLEGKQYVSKPVKELGQVYNIYVSKRQEGGAAQELIIEGEKATYKVVTGSSIRMVLCDGITMAKAKDGSMMEEKTMVPSAFFVITPIMEGDVMTGYTLYGGGHGHGAGMSQNAAKGMANAGYKATDILNFFFKGCTVQ